MNSAEHLSIERYGGWNLLIENLRKATGRAPVPSVTAVADEVRDPYRVLVSTIISLRTKDAVTLESSRRLFQEAPDLGALAAMETEQIAKLIYPAGFYRVKAAQLKTIATKLKETGVPAERDRLLALPGVGRKTANLVLGLAFGIPAICVDVHVHRISNRLGLITTTTPEKSELALEAILPRRYWIEINTLFVAFGQTLCKPVSPLCSRCPLADACPKNGVERSR